MPIIFNSLQKLLQSKERFLILMGLIMALLVLGPILEQVVAIRILTDAFLTAIVLSMLSILPGKRRFAVLGRLLDGHYRLQLAKNKFRQQVDQFLNIDEVQQAVQQSRLLVHCLFFLAQANAFMAYHPNNGEFQPLAPVDRSM